MYKRKEMLKILIDEDVLEKIKSGPMVIMFSNKKSDYAKIKRCGRFIVAFYGFFGFPFYVYSVNDFKKGNTLR